VCRADVTALCLLLLLSISLDGRNSSTRAPAVPVIASKL
jgi:hypothetical protein